MSYFNTTQQSGETLKEYRGKALTQEQEIYQFLSKYGLTFSASEIEDSLFKDRNIPITRPEATYRVIGNQLDLF